MCLAVVFRWGVLAPFIQSFLRTEIYDNEVFDARKIVDRWCCREYGIADWEPVSIVNIDKSLLTASKSLPVKIHERFTVAQVIHTPADEWVLDFGQNFAGVICFKTDALSLSCIVKQ